MTTREIVLIEDREDSLVLQLLSVWEKSVLATHHFLPEEYRIYLIPFVKEALYQIEKLLVCYSDKEPIAFMGIDQRKIEMLFVSPSYFRNGIGKQLIQGAISNYEVEYVDVNEQNIEALNFYIHLGFKPYSRQELDDFGKPYPIIHLIYK